MKIKEILTYIEQRFPYELAANFDLDKIGLTIGDENNELKGVLCALDLTLPVIEEAKRLNCNLIICHHPFTFTPLTKILANDEKGALIYGMVKNDISLIAMHTNMDLGIDGVDDVLCEMLKLKDSNYGENTKDKYIRHGYINEMSLKDLAYHLKDVFNLNGVKVMGDLDSNVKKIGILGGSGAHENDILNAIGLQCDCYITGEIKHSMALLSKYHNLNLIEVSHGIEKFVFNKLAFDIKEKFGINIYVSEIDSNLFKYL